MEKGDWVIAYNYRNKQNYYREGNALIKNTTINEALKIFEEKFPNRKIESCGRINLIVKEDGEIKEVEYGGFTVEV